MMDERRRGMYDAAYGSRPGNDGTGPGSRAMATSAGFNAYLAPPFSADPAVSHGLAALLHPRAPIQREHWASQRPEALKEMSIMGKHPASSRAEAAQRASLQRSPPAPPSGDPHSAYFGPQDWMYMQYPPHTGPMAGVQPHRGASGFPLMPPRSGMTSGFPTSRAPSGWGPSASSSAATYSEGAPVPEYYPPFAPFPPGRPSGGALPPQHSPRMAPGYPPMPVADSGDGDLSDSPLMETGELRARRRAACRRHRSRMRDLFDSISSLVPPQFFVPSLQAEMEEQFYDHYLPLNEEQPAKRLKKAKKHSNEGAATPSSEGRPVPVAKAAAAVAARNSDPEVSPCDSQAPETLSSGGTTEPPTGSDDSSPVISTNRPAAATTQADTRVTSSTSDTNSPMTGAGSSREPPEAPMDKEDFKRVWGGEELEKKDEDMDKGQEVARAVARPETPLPTTVSSTKDGKAPPTTQAVLPSPPPKPTADPPLKQGTREYVIHLAKKYTDADMRDVFASLTRPTILGATIAYAQYLTMTGALKHAKERNRD